MTQKRKTPEKPGPSKKKVYDVKENGKNATGRPSDYDEKYCTEIIEFFNREPYRLYDTDKGPVKVPALLPTFNRFAMEIGVNEDTIVEWSKVHPKFSAAYNVAKKLQKEFLINNGLAGLYPPASFCFVAKNITDMRDKQEVEHSGQVKTDLSTLTTSELLARAEALKKIEDNG